MDSTHAVTLAHLPSAAVPLTPGMPASGLRLLLGATALAVLVACSPTGGSAPPAPGGMPPPPAVGVVTVQPGAITLSTELPGRLEPIRTAQVRARVTGVVQKRLFAEGAWVQAGQSLYQIDAAPYRATLDSARATQTKAEAALGLALANLERNRSLAEAKAISPQEWLSVQANHKAAEADLAAAQAAVQQARLNVDYAAVQAPISGRIGRAMVTEGALVSQAEATLLATVQQVDTLLVTFTQSAAEVMKLRRAVDAGKLQGSGSAQVRVVLEDGSVYGSVGKLLFSDISVDASSGQVSLRAELPNPRGELLPGLYVKVRLEQARTDSAILLPQQAVTRGTAGDTVLVVGADQRTSPRTVQLGGARGNDWVVLGGLKAGEQVVVDGFQKIRPKTPVTPVPWVPGTPTGAAPAASGAASGAMPASAASR